MYQSLGIADKSKRGAHVPDFTLKDCRGNTVSLSDFRGKFVLLNFWASWCTPCTHELRSLENLQQMLSDTDFMVLGVAVQDETDQVCRLASEYGENLLLLKDDGSAEKLFQVSALPLTLLLDKEGRTIPVHDPAGGIPALRIEGPRDWDSPETLRQIKRILE